MQFIIKTPSQVFNGKRGGIHFSKGQATVDNTEKAELFKESFGYEVIEVKDEAEVETEAKPKTRKKRGE